jgi:hypothetical protein
MTSDEMKRNGRLPAQDVLGRSLLLRNGRIALLFLLLAALALTGCSRRGAPAVPATGSLEPVAMASPTGPLPSQQTSAVIRADEGGSVALKEGAQVSFPRQAVTGDIVANLRIIPDPPPAPLPRSIIGDAYELSVENGQLAGIASFRLPLPDGVTPDAYELSAYRWNGRAWERVGGRVDAGGIQFGSNVPALYSVQGRWRPGSAQLTLTTPFTDTLSASTPISVTGQYRYTNLPQIVDGLIPAWLTLKRDSSGGAGQITGIESLDETVAESPLLFQPDPGSAQGIVDFEYAFHVPPGAADVPPGSAARYYAILTVEDSEAPTRQTSTSVEQIQMFPIRIVGSEVIRPVLAEEGRLPLRWHVQLNGATLSQPPATDIALPLGPVLEQGGVGDYRIVLEAQIGDQWAPASNAVSVTLTLPGTRTPEVPSQIAGGGTPIASLDSGATPTPTDTPPPVPTRRPQPVFPTETPTATLTPTVAFVTATPTPSRPEWANVLWADAYSVPPGGCTTLHWDIEEVDEVYLNGVGVTGNQTQRVCPDSTTTYTLRAVTGGKSQNWTVTIRVEPTSQVAFEFAADSYEIAEGSCTTLRWRATNVRAVYLNGEGVPGESAREVCPDQDTLYELRVEDTNGNVTTGTLTVSVVPADRILIRFWSEQYTLNPDTCTTLHWAVQGVQAVYLDDGESERGVDGVYDELVCPEGNTTYTIRAVAPDGRSSTKTVTLEVGEPSLRPNEAIAQAVVRGVERVADVDPVLGGDQAGWLLTVDGVYPLFRGPGDCCQAALTLQVPQVFTTGNNAVDWPISAGQLVEFRALCLNAICSLPQGTPFYLRLRSN